MKMQRNENSPPKMISTHCVSNKETAKQMSLKCHLLDVVTKDLRALFIPL